MEWFAGNIEDAVLLSKRNKLIFVVGIFGKDETSRDLEKYVDCDIVKMKLKNDKDFVCIKVDPNSQDYMNFAQIYQLVPVPSIFFLGADGSPITVITEAKSQTEVVQIVDNVLSLSGKAEIEDTLSSELIGATSAAADAPSLLHLSDGHTDSNLSFGAAPPPSHMIDVTSSEMDKVVNEIPNIDIRTAHKSSSAQPTEGNKIDEAEFKALAQAQGQSVITENAVMNSMNPFTNSSISRSNFRDINQDFLKSEIELNRNLSEPIVKNPSENLKGNPSEIVFNVTQESAGSIKKSSESDLIEKEKTPINSDPVSKLKSLNSNFDVIKNDFTEIEKIENDAKSANSDAQSRNNSIENLKKEKTQMNIEDNSLTEDKLSKMDNKVMAPSTHSLTLTTSNTLVESSDKNDNQNYTKCDDKNDEKNEKKTNDENIVKVPSKPAQVNFVVDKSSTNIKSAIKKTTSSTSKVPLSDAVTDVQNAIQEENNKKKELLDEVKRARMEEEEAKKQILRKIASDKLERIARYGSTVDTPKSASQQQIQTPKQQPIDKDLSRIQFRAPDGQSHTHAFNMNDKFIVIREYVRTNIIQNAGVREFTLATNFPRHEFVPDDDEKTILELELYPSASILIITNNKQNKAAQVLAESGGFVNMIKSIVWSLVNPFYMMFARLGNYFSGNKNDNQQNNAMPRAVNLDNLRKSAVINDGASSSDKAKKKTISTSNIHRLRDSKDSDDENATWNGNSTQQQ